jgi:flagellar hook-length control protein FliK
MMNLDMWGFEPAPGFGVSTTDTVAGEPVGQGTSGAPEDLAFGARLAASLAGIEEEDPGEEAVPDDSLTCGFPLPMPEPVRLPQELPGFLGRPGESEGDIRAEEDPQTAETTGWTRETPDPAMSVAGIDPSLDPSVRAGTAFDAGRANAAAGAQPSDDVEPVAGRQAETTGQGQVRVHTRLPELRQALDQDVTAAAGQAAVRPGASQPAFDDTTLEETRVPVERGGLEARRVQAGPPLENGASPDDRFAGPPQSATDDRIGSVEIGQKRATGRQVVQTAGVPEPQADAISSRDIAPEHRRESSTAPKAPDGPATPAIASRDTARTDHRDAWNQHEQGESGGLQDAPLSGGDVQHASAESQQAFARTLADPSFHHGASVQVTSPAHVMTEAAPRVEPLFVPGAVEGFDPVLEGASAPIETSGPLPRETSDSIIQSIRLQYLRGGGDAVVHIKPEHLGPVSVSLRVENGSVSAVVNAENPAVAEWLKANEHLLREGLASSGLHLERFAITRDGHPPEGDRKGWRAPEDRARRRRALEPESTFEITV